MDSSSTHISVPGGTHRKFGLVLSGGGARGAYQAGVLQAIVEIAKSLGVRRPFPVITGVSAGAINASYLAAMSDDLELGCEKMAGLWSNLTAERVFKTDALTAGRSGFRFMMDATVGALYKKKLARSLLETSPLRALLEEHVPFHRIDKNVSDGHLDALAVTAMNYTNSNSVTWVQGQKSLGMWTRQRRKSETALIGVEHIMGSAAIPLFFPPIRVGEDHYGDGCLRNTAPLSPAIHLGADRLIVISVRRPESKAAPLSPDIEPSIARVLGVILNALLLDAVDVDMERMMRINQTLDLVPERQREELQLRKVDYLWLRPSHDIGHLAGELFDRLPRVIRYLVAGLGSSKEAAELTSYLLFDPDFCGQLVRMGYEDGIAQRADIAKFLTS